jgi:membrane protein YdbS with pleckstrin-like domain
VEKRAKAAETMSCSFMLILLMMLVLLYFVSKQNYGNFGAVFVRVLIVVARICLSKWFGLCFSRGTRVVYENNKI